MTEEILIVCSLCGNKVLLESIFLKTGECHECWRERQEQMEERDQQDEEEERSFSP